MSTANNKFLPAALLTVGLAASVATAQPVVEGLLNDLTATDVRIGEVDDRGRCIVIVALNNAEGITAYRPVASSNGDVKIFASIAAVQSLIARVKLGMEAPITIYRREKTVTVGDPVQRLKSLFRGYRSEKIASEKLALALAAKTSAAVALGWDVSVGTPEAAEYADYIVRAASIQESVAYCAERVATLGASLTAAGVDPLTV